MTCLKVCVLLLVASCAFASQSQLCAPDQLEVKADSYGFTLTGGLTKTSSYIHYDFTNSRSRTFEFVTISGVTHGTLTVIRYSGKTGMSYVIKLDTNKCIVSPLTTPFEKFCLPENSGLLQSRDIGVNGSLIVSHYRGTIFNTTVESTLAKQGNGYFPVHVASYGNQNGVGYFTGTAYYNLTLGIKDQSIFDIPAGCEKTDMP